MTRAAAVEHDIEPPGKEDRVKRTWRGWPALAIGALSLACYGGDAGDPAEAGDTEAAASMEARLDVPAAILGEAPPPRGEAARYFPADERAVGYLSVPEGEGPFPALILVHEWNGLVDRVRQVADAFADEGYVALAADLYQGRTGSNSDENIALMQEARGDMDRVIRNLDAAAAFLRARPDVTGRVGAMGWCFGGGIALSYGIGGEDHEATAIFYGQLVEDPEVLAGLSHEVYGTFAALDQGPAPESVERFRTALDAAGIQHDLHIYDAVNHGFWLRVEQDPDARGPAAEDAWRRLKDYLARTLN